MQNYQKPKDDFREPVPRYSFCSPSTTGVGPGLIELEPIAKTRLATHLHKQYGELLIVHQGEGAALLEDVAHEFSSPAVFILPAGSAHSFSFSENVSGWVIHIDRSFLDQINGRLTEFSTLWLNPQAIQFDDNADELLEILNDIHRLDEELAAKEVGYLVATGVLITAMFLQILRWITPTSPQPNTPASVEVRLVQDFLVRVEENFRQHRKIDYFTSRLGVSSSQLRTACENVCGKSPIKIIHERQLKEAKRCLLHTGMSAEQIADVLGFSSPAYFARFFKKETGLPASEYRRLYPAQFS